MMWVGLLQSVEGLLTDLPQAKGNSTSRWPLYLNYIDSSWSPAWWAHYADFELAILHIVRNKFFKISLFLCLSFTRSPSTLLSLSLALPLFCSLLAVGQGQARPCPHKIILAFHHSCVRWALPCQCLEWNPKCETPRMSSPSSSVWKATAKDQVTYLQAKSDLDSY